MLGQNELALFLHAPLRFGTHDILCYVCAVHHRDVSQVGAGTLGHLSRARLQGSEFRFSDLGFRILGFGLWFWVKIVGFWFFAFRFWFLIFGFWA